MKANSLQAAKLYDFLTPKVAGEPVNVHVVEFVKAPRADFAAMQKLIDSAFPLDGAKNENEHSPT